MDQRVTDTMKERSRRSIRSKRYNRRGFSEDKRPPKRLFTPEIKRFLKDWLVRRRDNPYPNRDEKKSLAIQTGLTYIQKNWMVPHTVLNVESKKSDEYYLHYGKEYVICANNASMVGMATTIIRYLRSKEIIGIGDVKFLIIIVCNWFANWRRKLKNSGSEPQKKSWGHLIKSYNRQVQGNVEHFSICSEDSIWQEPEMAENGKVEKYDVSKLVSEINAVNFTSFSNEKNQSLFDEIKLHNNNCLSYEIEEKNNPFSQNANKYKNHIIEKYLRDCQKPDNYGENYLNDDLNKPSMISRWLESAENFKPSENNYLTWTLMNSQKRKTKKSVKTEETHGKEELDAAEALTSLANANHSTM